MPNFFLGTPNIFFGMPNFSLASRKTFWVYRISFSVCRIIFWAYRITLWVLTKGLQLSLHYTQYCLELCKVEVTTKSLKLKVAISLCVITELHFITMRVIRGAVYSSKTMNLLKLFFGFNKIISIC